MENSYFVQKTKLHPPGKGGAEGTSCVRKHKLSIISIISRQSKIQSIIDLV